MNKHLLLNTITAVVDNWIGSLSFACGKGCSACCTAGVTITALEGEKILDYVVNQGYERWLATRLSNTAPLPPPDQTWNEFAAACLEERELTEAPLTAPGTCPLLEGDCCRIYPVRPLACRLFASTTACRPGASASLPTWYLDAATAISQVVEHLGQQEYWGRMVDVLAALLDINRYQAIATHLDPNLPIQARLRTRTARALPGFLFDDDERVTTLLNRLLATEVEGKCLGDILNGR